jgi:hypothetical protein
MGDGDRLAGKRPCEDRGGLATVGIGLLAAELLAMVAFAAWPAQCYGDIDGPVAIKAPVTAS